MLMESHPLRRSTTAKGEGNERTKIEAVSILRKRSEATNAGPYLDSGPQDNLPVLGTPGALYDNFLSQKASCRMEQEG